MLVAGLFYSPFFFGTRPGGGGGVLAFLQCVLCAWPGLGWDPYPLFTLSHFSDPPTFLSPHWTPPPFSIHWLQHSHCQQQPGALHKTPLTLSSLYHLLQQFLMFSLYFCAVWAPWQQVPVLVTQIRWVVWETWGKKWSLSLNNRCILLCSDTHMMADFKLPQNNLWLSLKVNCVGKY